MAIDWPQLPFNARATDAAFVAAAIAILAGARSWAIPLDRARHRGHRLHRRQSACGVLVARPPRQQHRAGASCTSVDIYIVIQHLPCAKEFTGTVASGLALSGGVLATLSVIAITVQAIFGAT